MNDMRVLGIIVLGVLTLFGLLLAKAFSFSTAYIWWPMGCLAVLFCCLVLIMWNANVG